MYNGKIELANNDVKTNVAVLIAADELCLNELCISIEEHLLENETLLKQNFVLIRNITNKLTHYINLSQFYETAFQQDPSLLFKANDFTTLDQETLLDLLKMDHSLKPIEVWDMLMEWCIAQSDK